MPIFKVKVKWGKETFKDVEANTDEDPLVFKAQLFALTGVLPERQKIVIKGINLKDWASVSIKDGIPILLMGSKEEDVPVAPAVKTVFMEDMSENELATAMDLPAGLSNLGNTCYMNAVVQCLKTVPELRESLTSFSSDWPESNTGDFSAPITSALRDLYGLMDRSGQDVLPLALLRVLHLAFPRFAERGQQGGGYQQQDANECWTELVRMLQLRLPARHGEGSTSSFSSMVDQYFGGSFVWEMKCSETDDEPPVTGKEQFLQLSCFISQDVKYMMSGLKNKLQEQITKASPILGRDAIYVKTSLISRLPAYLTVQFVRFFYKERESINAKILKDVKFPLELDVLELCTPELRERLTPARDRFKEQEDKLVEDSLQGKHVDPKKETKAEPYSFPEDVGSNNSGYYTLQAVLTHKGRSSSSGHYVAWVRHTEKTWLKCDDDQVSAVTEEDVLKLSGGGDWHCAYVLLYGPKVLRLPIE